MKKLLFILCLVSAFGAEAQKTPQNISGPRTIAMVRGELRVDSAAYFGILDTSFTPTRVGALVFRAADSSFYYSQSVSTRPYWVRFGSGGGGTAAWGNITGTLSSQTDLQAALDAKQDLLTLGTSSQIRMGDHSLQGATSLITSVGDPRYSQLGHLHTSGNISDFSTAVRSLFTPGIGISITDGVITATGSGSAADSSVFATRYWTSTTYSPLGHLHSISDVTNLQTSLDAKANLSHTHNASTDITAGTLPIARGGTGLSTIGTSGQVPRVATGGTTLEYYTPVKSSDISDSLNNNQIYFDAAHFEVTNGATASAPDTVTCITCAGSESGSLVIPINRVPYGTGTGYTSSPNLLYNGINMELNATTASPYTWIASKNLTTGLMMTNLTMGVDVGSMWADVSPTGKFYIRDSIGGTANTIFRVARNDLYFKKVDDASSIAKPVRWTNGVPAVSEEYAPIEFEVGVTANAPTNGGTTITLPAALSTRSIRLIVGGVEISTTAHSTYPYFTKSGTTVTLVNATFTTGDMGKIIILQPTATVTL